MRLDIGAQVGPYQVLSHLGRGGTADVYEVRDARDDSLHALKVVHHPDPRVRARIHREGQAQQAVRHPNVVAVTDLVWVDGEAGLIMELVRGPTLETFLATESPLDLPLVDALGEGIVRGVQAAHRAGRLHRDLKPANVLLAPTGESWIPKVADFGLTKLTDPVGTQLGRTETGILMGTPGYMAPEQARDARSVDVRADVFSLGCVLYEIATGQRAFGGEDRFEALWRATRGHCTPVHLLRTDLPERHVRAISGALLPRLSDRIGDCDVLLAVWRGEQHLGSVTPRPYDPTTLPSVAGWSSGSTTREERQRPRRESRWRWGLLAALVALGSMVALVSGTPAPSSPTVVRIHPPPDSRGVRVGTRISIRFSEPMHRERTERALVTSAPATLTWNADATELAVDLPLEYADGTELRTPARRYDLRLTTSATDRWGHNLETPVAWSFTTARRIRWSPSVHVSLYGNSADGGHSRFYFIGAGDHGDAEFRSIMSWHLPDVEVVEVEKATLTSRVHRRSGTPEHDFSGLVAERVRADSFTEGFSGRTSSDPVLVHNDDGFALEGALRADVREPLADAFAVEDPMLQLRFRFVGAPSLDGEADHVYFRRSETSLTTTLLVR